MLNWFKLATKSKAVCFIDGDSNISGAIKAWEKYVKCQETIFVRYRKNEEAEPRSLRKENRFSITYLNNFEPGKENVDKYIAILIQKYISNNYDNIIVISEDYDFIDIFSMLVKINSDKPLNFELIIPKAQGKLINPKPVSFNLKITKIQ